MTRRAGLVAGLFVLATAIVGWMNWPQPQRTLAAVTSDLSQRDEGQIVNITRAAVALDGVTVNPGEPFSFNAVVGPRTVARGYREATALMEGDRIRSVGGGICQVSSTLYGAAKRANCNIIRRVPHKGHVASVPPGEDATVWYGGADLIWDPPIPVRIRAQVQGTKLIVSLVAL